MNDCLDDCLSFHYLMSKTLIHFRVFSPSLVFGLTTVGSVTLTKLSCIAELSFSFVALTMKPGIASVIVRINVGRVKLISFEKNVPLQMNNLVVLRGVCNRLHNKCTPK